jgi:cytochrome d ubiquinol oxidase subunit II
MLTGLVLRGVAFEYRHRAEGSHWICDIAFAGGSLVAAFPE